MDLFSWRELRVSTNESIWGIYLISWPVSHLERPYWGNRETIFLFLLVFRFRNHYEYMHILQLTEDKQICIFVFCEAATKTSTDCCRPRKREKEGERESGTDSFRAPLQTQHQRNLCFFSPCNYGIFFCFPHSRLSISLPHFPNWIHIFFVSRAMMAGCSRCPSHCCCCLPLSSISI